MALLDVLSPRFALPREEAHSAIRRMVRVFFAPQRWSEAERQVDERFARGERYGYAEGEPAGPYDPKPATIAWKPYEEHPQVVRVDIHSHKFGHHLVDMITIEHQVGRKVQPFGHGFRLERPTPLHDFDATLAEVLGHPVAMQEHVQFRAKLRFILELLGGFPEPTDAPTYHDWLRDALSQQERLRLKAAYEFVWSRRRGKELIRQLSLTPAAIAAGLTGLLQEGGSFPPATAASLATRMLEQFPSQWDWRKGVYAPLRIPIESDTLEVEYTYPFGVRDGVPHIPADASVTAAELLLHPDLSQPCLGGIYDRQCLILDAVDELRRSFGLAPDARYEHYRRQALQD